ncbi:MAG: type II toxin-antitoxin system RelB/DinJ family antitoxin [Clostridia bacterium]|nr:type II toxin-antitoxin system RelB/DinJ family antitoxin [Clostridia bacterium]
MAKTDTLNIRIEPELKKEVEGTLNDLGMNIAEAVTIFLKQVVLTDSIPFAIKKPKFSDDMLEAIAEADEILKNPDKYKSYNNLGEILEDIKNDETI